MDVRMTLEIELDERYISPRPVITWKPQTANLSELVRDFHLPQVVQCDVKDCPISVYNVNFDLTQPLLLCMNRTVRKICARNLAFDRPSKSLKEVGEPVLIPEDYKGWFAVLKDGSRVPHFGSIAAIATSRVCRFLVTTKLVGFYILSDKSGSMTYARRELLPGDVLRSGKVYVGTSKVSKEFGLFKKKKKKDVEVKYLKCTDETDREILINLDQSGTFYPISYTNGSVTGCVMQLKQILKKLYFPLDVKLVYGRIPNAPCSFSGMLRLTASFEEDTVVASTMMNYKNILLELSTQSVLLFKVASPTRQLLESRAYQQALEMCQERAEVYVRDMKVSFDFIAEVLPPASNASETSSSSPKVSVTNDPTPPGPIAQTKTEPRKTSDAEKSREAVMEQCGYIDTSGATTKKSAAPVENGAEYEMIWLTSETKVKKRDRSAKGDESKSVESRASFRLSLEGTYLSCPIFSTDDRVKGSSEDTIPSDKPQSKRVDDITLDIPPPPLPPRIPRPSSKRINGSPELKKPERTSIYEVLKKTKPVEQALRFQDNSKERITSTVSNSSSGSNPSGSGESSTTYDNSSNTSIGDNWLELNGLEDLRDYDFPEPYLLRKPSESDYSPVGDAPKSTENTQPLVEVVSYYDSGSYRPVSPGEYVDDLPLGASSANVGASGQSGTSGRAATLNSNNRDGVSAVDASADCSASKTVGSLSGLSVEEVGDALRRLGLKNSVIDSFAMENIDGDLLCKFNEATLQETFPSLRSLDIRKISLYIQSGWQPNV